MTRRPGCGIYESHETCIKGDQPTKDAESVGLFCSLHTRFVFHERRRRNGLQSNGQVPPDAGGAAVYLGGDARVEQAAAAAPGRGEGADRPDRAHARGGEDPVRHGGARRHASVGVSAHRRAAAARVRAAQRVLRKVCDLTGAGREIPMRRG